MPKKIIRQYPLGIKCIYNTGLMTLDMPVSTEIFLVTDSGGSREGVTLHCLCTYDPASEKKEKRTFIIMQNDYIFDFAKFTIIGTCYVLNKLVYVLEIK